MPSSETAKEIHDTLADLYETSDKSHSFFLKNLLFSSMMDEKTTFQAHKLKIKDLCDQLEAIGHKMEKEDMVLITLKSMS